MNMLGFQNVLINGHWQNNVSLKTDSYGDITEITEGAPDGSATSGFALPGMPNAHSHAFQRAMAGLAEYSSNPDDSFWTWRETMYDFSAKISPEDLYHIGRYLYAEMLKSGYTSVAEFHYLHHQPDGTPYDNVIEMGAALARAAQDVGIGFTLLPVFYMQGGFDGRPLNDRQQRFKHSTESFLTYLETAQKADIHCGIAFHSLRAVPEDAMRRVLASDLIKSARNLPIHIHIAEQMPEVNDSIAHFGRRPVEWLLDNFDLGPNWHMVHATHMTAQETENLARTGAVAVICPTTEGNLGDGLFSLEGWNKNNGQLAIGSDSHISVDPFEELRWLEYGQRLTHQKRGIYISKDQPHTGAKLYADAVAGGALSLGRNCADLSVGQKADIVVIRDDIPSMALARSEQRLDTLIFTSPRQAVRDVYVGGRQVIKNGRHPDDAQINSDYFKTLEKLLS